MLDKVGVLTLAAYPQRRLMEYARRAEELGFGCFWYADERLYHETYVGLTACALATTRIRLGPAVTDPYSRHPALTAMAISSLDEISDGRAILGLGAGSMGFEQLGLRLHRPAATLRDAIKVIRRLWAGEHVSYEGEQFVLREANMELPTRPGIPIYLAADGPRTLRVAGELADAVVVAHCASPKILDTKLEPVRAGRGTSPAPTGRASSPASTSASRATAPPPSTRRRSASVGSSGGATRTSSTSRATTCASPTSWTVVSGRPGRSARPTTCPSSARSPTPSPTSSSTRSPSPARRMRWGRSSGRSSTRARTRSWRI
jgi:alkanesulfonate monooxygenase SsuD/methylene tetrahydromethanopterin reductase-like flavin-dependent oxidoreductase (luciferase family)